MMNKSHFRACFESDCMLTGLCVRLQSKPSLDLILMLLVSFVLELFPFCSVLELKRTPFLSTPLSVKKTRSER